MNRFLRVESCDYKAEPIRALRDAEADRRAGRYRGALEKHIWFHECAEQADRGLVGVRLSFALAEWYQLGLAFPPAMDALIESRDRAETAYKYDLLQVDGFRDAAAINRALGCIERTAELFRFVAESDPSKASKVYLFAEAALIATGEYKLCGDFLNYRPILDAITFVSPWEAAEKTMPPGGLYLLRNTVALLVINHRCAEAWAVAREADSRLPGQRIFELLASALEGQLPSL